MRSGRLVNCFVGTLTVVTLMAAAGAQEKSVRPGINPRSVAPSLDVTEWMERFEGEGREQRPVAGQLLTRWAGRVSPDTVWAAYPRPQLVRDGWVNLNGLWDYAIRPREEPRPKEFDGKILVPFAAESALSGVKKPVGKDNRLWYRRSFPALQTAAGQRLLLHFGGVDWHSVVWLNGRQVGEHRGGYDPFSIDITDALTNSGLQELVVSVWDPVDQGFQPRGKQVTKPRGIWYTSVTGIWQTVWLEPVPESYIHSVRLTPDIDRSELRIQVESAGSTSIPAILSARARAGEQVVAQGQSNGNTLTLKLNSARLWSPHDPFLYEMDLRLESGEISDSVRTYFGMRKIEVRKAEDGYNRLFLNNEPLFQFGPLDQGWWPDGLYSAPCDEALQYDLGVTKKLGFNMIRKHVKVEPARWYYHCDKLGLMVWQDMPNGDKHIGGNDADLRRTEESAQNYRREYRAMIDTLYNHPCIVCWVPFNEGWGQFATNEILDWTKEYDSTRLVDAPSGWADRGGGDMRDMHSYPGPAMPDPEEERAVVLGEFGGLGLPIEDHLWREKDNWGYRTFQSREELQKKYEMLIRQLRPLIGAGLAAAVYTQATDVEGEVNGLMTYDRALIKYDIERLRAEHRQLYLPPPIVIRRTFLPTSDQEARTWRYSLDAPADDWQRARFDDAAWLRGPGGFGRDGTPNATVRTPWTTSEIWLRQTFQLDTAEFKRLHLRIHHDEDAEVYINGHRVVSLTGFTTRYVELELDDSAVGRLRPGMNTIAVHCRQTDGGQYIDVGLVDIEERPR